MVFLCVGVLAASLHSVLFYTVHFPLLFSWLVAFYKMLSVLTSKWYAKLNNCCIASRSSPTGLLRGTVGWKLVSSSSLRFNISARMLLTGLSHYGRDSFSSDSCIKQECDRGTLLWRGLFSTWASVKLNLKRLFQFLLTFSLISPTLLQRFIP